MGSLQHDAAWVLTQSILEIFALNESEKAEAFAEIYTRAKAALEAYDIQAERMQRRLNPCNN